LILRRARQHSDAHGYLAPEARAGPVEAASQIVAQVVRACAGWSICARPRMPLPVAVPGAPGPTGRIARALFGRDARQPEATKEILGDTQHGYQHTWLSVLWCLEPAAVATVYAGLDAVVRRARTASCGC
jgi:hypothetical protein